MMHVGIKQAALAKLSGVSQKTISDLLNYGNNVSKSPRLDTLNKLAEALGTTAWLLQIENDPPLDLLLNKRIEKLVENYVEAPELGRETVDRIAESEVRYHVVKAGGNK